jgi:3-dehydroquinate dehydratase
MNNGKLCISICASTVSEMLDLARSTAVDCDLIEMRLDCLSELNANDLTDLDENMILTLRPQEQGGNRVISIDERIGFWSNASGGCGADVEEDMMGKVDVSKFQPQILSFHNHSRTPDVDAV